jgi:hypothetical protein
MPTSRHRYTVTETEPIAEAMEKARRLLHSDRDNVVLTHLIVRGAEALEREVQAARHDTHRRERLKQRFLRRSASFEGLDPDALLTVREEGWTRERES